MSEGGSNIESQPNAGGYPGGDAENGESRSRWLVASLLATGLLIVMAVGAYFMFGRELFQRPLLAVLLLVAWLGALVGISL